MTNSIAFRPTLAKVRAITLRVLVGRPEMALPPLPTHSELALYLREGGHDDRQPHPLFDPLWYRAQSPVRRASDSDLTHYLREGDRSGLSPHPLFDPSWYRAQSLDLRPGDTTLSHYVREGDAAGFSPHPLFDPAWYRSQLPDLRPGDTSLSHYLSRGDAAGLSPHPLFDPIWYRRLEPELPAGRNALLHFLTSGFDLASYVEHVRRHPELRGLRDNPLVRHLNQRGSRVVARPLAATTMTPGNRLLRSVADDGARLPWSAPRTDSVRRLAGSTALAASERRIIVYTCCYANYEGLKEPEVVDPSVRYIAFTDNPNLRSEHWEICVLNDYLGSFRRTSRLPKLLPHLYLPDHDFSIYIDASFGWKAPDARAMITACLEDREIGLYRHKHRDCVFEEIDLCEQLGIERPELLAFYREHYADLQLPTHAGLYENGLIVRKNTPAISALNEAWWCIYRGERDQLALMSALHTTGTPVNAIKQGKQIRKGPYLSYAQHERAPLRLEKPKLYVFIAYAPPDFQQDLGRTYNDYMQLLDDGDYALFLDHDAMFCSPDWFRLVQQIMVGYDGIECLTVARTNRIGNPYQRVGVLTDEHRASVHADFSSYLQETQRDWMTNVSQLDSTSGVVLLLSKQTWKKWPFSNGFLKVDNRMHQALRGAGRPVFMPSSLYVYHFYRADGDVSHAKVLDEAPASALLGDAALPNRTAEHRLRNFVYDEASGLDLSHYAGLMHASEWAIFLRSDAMFCDRSWYARVYARLNQLPEGSLLTFNNNVVDATAPRGDDIIEHRAYAASLPVSEPSVRHQPPTANDLIAFMIGKPLLDRLATEDGRNVEDLRGLMERSPGAVFEDRSTYVFCQAGAQPDLEAPSRPTRGELDKALGGNRRVAILTLGFWPSQAGMELMIHNLAVHLTRAGDLVTLYAPRPEKAFEEIPHNYLLKRFKSERHFLELFRRQHAVLPVDVLLVQGGLEAASMALILKRELGVPVVLRTHGEDIQIDDSTGYGYRRDAVKRAVIDENIRTVDRNIVIGEHILPLVKQIAPNTMVETIHNGVDVDRFRPQQTRYLRDKLGLGDDKLILLMVGRNVKKKALHLALHALKAVLPRVPEAVLVHAGKDGNGENLQEVAESLGVAHAFYSLGEVNYFDTPLIYASADLFVFPSKVETFGNVTVEALSSGLPCVEFDYSVNRNKIASGRNGYVVPFGEVTELADRIVELLRDPEKRRAFALEARRSAVATFAWQRVAERYRGIFQEFRSTAVSRDKPVNGFGALPFSSQHAEES